MNCSLKYEPNNSSNCSINKIYTTLRVVQAVTHFFRSMTPVDEGTSTALLPDKSSVINTPTAYDDDPQFTSTTFANAVQESSNMDIETADYQQDVTSKEKQSTTDDLVTAQTILQDAEESVQNLTYETTRLER